MAFLGYLCALAIGLTLGMLGGGGSILAVPVFMYVLGYGTNLAIAMSYPVVAATSFVGAIGHWRAGNVRLPVAFGFGAVATASAFTAARLSVHLTERAKLAILGVTVLTAAALMLRDSLGPSAQPPVGARAPMLVTLPLAALFVGALTGVVGVAGGFVIVPALVVLARVPMREAVGTSLTVITLNAVAAFAGHPRIDNIPAAFVITFTLVAMAGVLAGTRLVRFVDQRMLKRAFSVLLLVIGALLLLRYRASL